MTAFKVYLRQYARNQKPTVKCLNFVQTEFWYSFSFGVTWPSKLACYEESTGSLVWGLFVGFLDASETNSGVNPGGVLGQDPTNFFPCPGPHIGGPGLNFHKI